MRELYQQLIATGWIDPWLDEEKLLPRRLRAWHYLDYFPAERREWAFRHLLESLRLRLKQSAPRE